MAKINANMHNWGDINNAVRVARQGVAFPAGPYPTAIPSGWGDVGWISDAGVVENATYQETKKYGWQGGSLIRTLRDQAEHTFDIEFLELNATTAALIRPNSVTTTTGGTAEVQTVTINGSPTGGTFTLSWNGVSSGAQAYNVATSALQTALQAAWGVAVTVTGTAGSSYVLTFPSALGNVAAVSVVSALTGGTTPSATIATTTPGVNPINAITVAPFTGLNLLQFMIDISDGTVHHRFQVANGEISPSGIQASYTSGDLTVYKVTLNCYPDSNGNFFTDVNDNPALAQSAVSF